MANAGSSPPLASTAGGTMDPMSGGMFAAGGFDGLNPHMFTSGLVPGDMDFGSMDWTAVSAWGGPFSMVEGVFGPFSNPSMMQGPGPR